MYLGQNFNDLPTLPPRAGFGGVGGSGTTSARVDRRGAASTIPVDQEADGDSEVNPDDFIVQAIPSARQGATSGKRSLEADVTANASGTVPKRPRRTCTLRSATTRDAIEEQPEEEEEDTSFFVRQMSPPDLLSTRVPTQGDEGTRG
ncbi:unnamed protein product [Miscanthus lutarioriparius]|uniref:Uncharacterized protein n=1 Tax=Miscanthus lutarioriparius TaxID=422564 RepID=A0A811QVQ3_9POAL|nr:unnamed protein product [Miscanthus lutarioriparius]